MLVLAGPALLHDHLVSQSHSFPPPRTTESEPEKAELRLSHVILSYLAILQRKYIQQSVSGSGKPQLWPENTGKTLEKLASERLAKLKSIIVERLDSRQAARMS